MSIFIKATKSNWYSKFLEPVVHEIAESQSKGTVLDVGTGPGTLPLLLRKNGVENPIIGLDPSIRMIQQALKDDPHQTIRWERGRLSEQLNSNQKYSYISFCSVLYLFSNSSIENELNTALQLLENDGRILVLSPTGKREKKETNQAKGRANYRKNYTYFIWKWVTSARGRAWNKKRPLQKFANKKHKRYEYRLVFHGQACLEILSNRNPIN